MTPGPGDYKDRALDQGKRPVIGKAPRDKKPGFVNEVGPGSYKLPGNLFVTKIFMTEVSSLTARKKISLLGKMKLGQELTIPIYHLSRRAEVSSIGASVTEHIQSIRSDRVLTTL